MRAESADAQTTYSYRELIRDNIDYDILIEERPLDKEKIDELVELMVEAVCSGKRRLYVAGENRPKELVRSRFLKMGRDHIEYVLNSLSETTTLPRKPKQYLLTSLWNAPMTIENAYAARVRRDLEFMTVAK